MEKKPILEKGLPENHHVMEPWSNINQSKNIRSGGSRLLHDIGSWMAAMLNAHVIPIQHEQRSEMILKTATVLSFGQC